MEKITIEITKKGNIWTAKGSDRPGIKNAGSFGSEPAIALGKLLFPLYVEDLRSHGIDIKIDKHVAEAVE